MKYKKSIFVLLIIFAPKCKALYYRYKEDIITWDAYQRIHKDHVKKTSFLSQCQNPNDECCLKIQQDLDEFFDKSYDDEYFSSIAPEPYKPDSIWFLVLADQGLFFSEKHLDIELQYLAFHYQNPKVYLPMKEFLHKKFLKEKEKYEAEQIQKQREREQEEKEEIERIHKELANTKVKI